MDKLTSTLRERLIEILVAEGCDCEEEHDFPEDATSLNCLASTALWDLEMAREHIEEIWVAAGRPIPRNKLVVAVRQWKEERDAGQWKLRDAEHKIKCYENWIKSLTLVEKEIDPLSSEAAHRKLRQVAMLSNILLKDPSLMDSNQMAEDRKRAMEAYERGDCVTLDETREILRKTFEED